MVVDLTGVAQVCDDPAHILVQKVDFALFEGILLGLEFLLLLETTFPFLPFLLLLLLLLFVTQLFVGEVDEFKTVFVFVSTYVVGILHSVFIRRHDFFRGDHVLVFLHFVF